MQAFPILVTNLCNGHNSVLSQAWQIGTLYSSYFTSRIGHPKHRFVRPSASASRQDVDQVTFLNAISVVEERSHLEHSARGLLWKESQLDLALQADARPAASGYTACRKSGHASLFFPHAPSTAWRRNSSDVTGPPPKRMHRTVSPSPSSKESGRCSCGNDEARANMLGARPTVRRQREAQS